MLDKRLPPGGTHRPGTSEAHTTHDELEHHPMTAPLTVAELGARLGLEFNGPLANRKIHGITGLELATEEQAAYVTREAFVDQARKSAAGVLIVPDKMQLERDGVLRVPDVMAAVLALLEHFHPDPPETAHVAPSAIVHSGAEIGENVYIGENAIISEGARVGAGSRIGAGCYLGAGCHIGERCLLAPRVTVLERCLIGNRVRLHPGAVIGGDGFRFEKIGGRLRRIPQVGIVVLEDDVEVGANSTIDRASLVETRIGARTKIDNMVHIAHNCRVGTDCIIVAQAGIAGSTTIGRGVMIAGQAGIADNIRIGDGVMIAGGSGVHGDLPAGARVMGYPAVPVREYAKFLYFYRHFSSYWQKLKGLLEEKQG